MRTWLRRIALSIAVLAGALLTSVYLYMQHPKFGELPSGDRLDRIKASPHYANGRFQNLVPTPILTGEYGSLVALLSALRTPTQRSTPDAPLPSMKTNLNALDSNEDVLVWLGHSSYFGYRKFDLSLTLRAYLGNYVYNNVASNLGTYSEVGRASPYNLHASVLETGFKSPQYLSDYYVEDASFLRLDNISLGYSFKYKTQTLRAFTTVQNVFTTTDYTGVDPTAGLNGLDNNIYPRSRTFTAGANIRF